MSYNEDSKYYVSDCVKCHPSSSSSSRGSRGSSANGRDPNGSGPFDDYEDDKDKKESKKDYQPPNCHSPVRDSDEKPWLHRYCRNGGSGCDSGLNCLL